MKTDTPWSLTIDGRPMGGGVAEWRRRIWMHDVKIFSGMTGDMKPLHYDEAVAKTSPFGGQPVQGA